MMLKRFPEDFIVEEIPEFTLKDEGQYGIYKLWKKNLNTEQAVEFFCEKLNIPRDRVKYAGTKDKNAITTQYLSIERTGSRKLSFENEQMKLEFKGYLDAPLSLGSLKGNRFTIKLRDVSDNKINRIISLISNKPENSKWCPNYYDEQRFSKNNFQVGLHILKKEYKKAVELIITNQGSHELKIRGYLQDNPTNYVNALAHVPKKILSMNIHSVQSYIFNELLRMEIEKLPHHTIDYSLGKLSFPEDTHSAKDSISKELPLIGFDTIITDNIRKITDNLGIVPRDFIIKAIPGISAESLTRQTFVEINELKIERSSDVHGEFLEMRFWLDKGAYATMVVKSLIQL